jgi:hypothetical protein
MLQIKKMRLPTCEEYDLLATAVKEDNNRMHWNDMFSWCQDADPALASTRAVRGYHSARLWTRGNATARRAHVGFRPAVEIPNPDSLTPDGTIVTVGSLYMDGKPVKVPQSPTKDGDIPDYIPGAKLEMREALDDPDYQVKAIKAGDILIADRVLLKNISWDDAQDALRPEQTETHDTQKALNSGKMRLPTCEEYDLLVTTTKGNNDIMHWAGIFSWCQDKGPNSAPVRAVRGYHSARNWFDSNATSRSEGVGFRPVVEILNPDPPTPDGTIVTVGTLYMDDKPVKVPQNPTKDGGIPDYIPGAKLEMREALDDPSYQVRAIKAGDVLIADRVLLKNISWMEVEKNIQASAQVPSSPIPRDQWKIKSVRLPTSLEWDRMIDIMVGVNSRVHWAGSYSWCSDKDPNDPGQRVARGQHAGRHKACFKAKSRLRDIGFRPVFVVENSEAISEGKTTVIGTLYMNGQPVSTSHNGDTGVPEYIPGATLEFREPMEDSRYQVEAIKTGSALIADRILLRHISWDDLDKLGFCGDTHEISEGDTKMKQNQAVIYIGDAEHGSCIIICSRQNEKRVRAILTKWYPKWAKDYKGRELALWSKVHDTVDVMRDLLEDEDMEVLGMGDKAVIRLEDEVYGTCAVACSQENEQKVKAFLTTRYPKWADKCIGKTGMTPWNDVLDAVKDMKELLGDNRLEFLGGCGDILIPEIAS